MNPAHFPDDVLERMSTDPAGSIGWPSRYGRCFAAEVLRLRRRIAQLEGALKEASFRLDCCATLLPGAAGYAAVARAALNEQHQDLAKGAE